MKKMNYIDLGLPSGTLWADADANRNYYCSLDSNSWKKDLPSPIDFEELGKHCDWKYNEENKCWIVTGQNGNQISLDLRKGVLGHVNQAFYATNNRHYKIVVHKNCIRMLYETTSGTRTHTDVEHGVLDMDGRQGGPMILGNLRFVKNSKYRDCVC